MASNLFSGVLYFNFGRNGWSEIFRFPSATRQDARARLLAIAAARSYVMAAGCELVFACVRQATIPPVQWPVLPAKLESLKLPGGAEYWQPLSTTDEALLFTPETPSGKYAPRWLHGYADDEVTGGEWIRAGLVVPPGPVAAPPVPNLASKDQLWQYCLATIRDNTVWARRTGANLAAGSTTWEIEPWDSIPYRYTEKRDSGRSWLIVSWEAADYAFANDFSPCGAKVAAVRSCYEAPCVFHQGGAEKRIRWYVAYDDAAILPWPTVFWPLSQELQYSNTSGIAEATGAANRAWSSGFSWSNAPGLGPTGTADQFLGLGLAPYDDDAPTPEPFLPECDLPAPTLLVDNDPNTVTVTSCQHITVDASTLQLTLVAPGWARLRAILPPGVDQLAVRLADYYATDLHYEDGTGWHTASWTRVSNNYTLTANGPLGLPEKATPLSISSYLGLGDRVLLDQGSADSGLLEVTFTGDSGNPATLTRTSDFRAGTVSRTQVAISSGIDHIHERYLLTTADPITINTTALTFELVGSPNLCSVWRDELNEKLFPAFGASGGNVQLAGFKQGTVLEVNSVVTFATNYNLTIGYNTHVYLAPTNDNLQVTITAGVEGQTCWLFNRSTYTIQIHVKRPGYSVADNLWFNLSAGQCIQIIFQHTPFLYPGDAGQHGWVLVDSLDHVAGPPSAAEVLALILANS